MEAHKGHRVWETHARGGGQYYGAPMIRAGEQYREDRYVTDVITDNALSFLEDHRGQDVPFYLGVHYTAPHSPWEREQHPTEIYDKYFQDCAFESVPNLPIHPWQHNTAPIGDTPEKRREYLSGYYAAVTAMDQNIGRLLNYLAAHGLTEKTLIVFTSDNGMNMGHHGIYGKGNGTYPMNMFDTSVKVPCILSCPGQIPEACRSDALFSHYDFFPSLLGFLGFLNELPANLPGKDLSHVWRVDAQAPRDMVVVYDEYGPVRMIRDMQYKYVQRYPDGPNEFYDLVNDPDEIHNLIAHEAHQEAIRHYSQQLNEWFCQYVNPSIDGSRLPVNGFGQLDSCTKEDAFFVPSSVS